LKFLNEQAQLLLVAAVLIAVALSLLYAALGIYGLLVTKIIRHIGLFGAIVDFSREKRNRQKWWIRLPLWWERLISRRHE
jgi:hypothetical protein